MSSHAGARRLGGAVLIAVSLCALAVSGDAFEQPVPAGAAGAQQGERRHFDARPHRAVRGEASAVQLGEIAALLTELPQLAAEVDQSTGVTRTLWNRAGYLTGKAAGSHKEIADRYLAGHTALLGLSEGDIVERELTDLVYSDVTGATHLYYRQRVSGIPVYNTQLQVNVNRDGRIISVNNSFLPDIEASLNRLQPALDPAGAVRAAADHLDVANAHVAVVGAKGNGAQRITELRAENLSTEAVNAKVMLLPMGNREARLVWNFAVHTPDQEHSYDFTVDAETGAVWTRFDWVASDQYKVYRAPVESPRHTSPAPPADGRVTVVSPANVLASPFGWHDTNGAAGPEFTIMRGNNAHAYVDASNTSTPPATQPDCGGSIDCTFALDLTQSPSAYRAAAVTNLFYWTNLVHDVQYQYGFNEAAGNFQINNYGRGGKGDDGVLAEAQDGGGANNANFRTPPDGQPGRMQMYLWDWWYPQIFDGDLDASVIVHEYGHGISNRLVGGPSNVSCLTNDQQPGEGISDFLALVYTAKASDTGPQARGIGTYVVNQPPSGGGIRELPYSTNSAVNNWTYASISGKAAPHGVGSVWAQGMWKVYWALVNQHGFDANLYNAAGSAGNQRAMLYLTEGLKNTPCSPTFVQVRDAILQAAADNHGGEDVCLMWNAYAAFGLGIDAVSNGPWSTEPVNGFASPALCGGTGATLSINDASVTEGHSGSKNASFTVSLNAAAAQEVRVRYATSDGSAGATTTVASGLVTIEPDGKATPYPATLAVSGLAGTIEHLRVRLNGFWHNAIPDVDMLLVGPAGQKIVLLSDIGGWGAAGPADLTFEDGAPAMPADGLITGTYSPTNLLRWEEDTFAAPAPAGPYPATELAVFNGTNPNGAWTLYVYDDTPGFIGELAGWSLEISTTKHDYSVRTGTLVFPPGVTTQTIDVPVHGDTAGESNETFLVTLSDPEYAVIGDGEGIGTIVDDDPLPAAATPIAPVTQVATATPTYSWQAVALSTWYQLSVTDATGTVIQQWYTAAQAGCAGTATCAVTPAVAVVAGSVTWSVRTWNDAGYGPWSAPATFTGSAPGATTPISPAGVVATATPTYTWNAHPQSTWYLLWVNDSTGNRVQAWYTAAQAGCAAGTGTCSATPSTALTGGGQFWVRTWNSFGYGPWSSGSTFTDRAFSVTATWPVSGAAPGATVRLWGEVKNNTGSAVPAGANVWFKVTAPGGAVSWVGYKPATGLAAGATAWYYVDWAIPAGASGTYQYEAQVWNASGAASAPSAPRAFTVGSS